MADGMHYVRLDRTLNHAAHKLARGVRMKKDTWLAQMLVEWGGGWQKPAEPKPKEPDTRDLVDLRLLVDDEVWKNIAARARWEGKDVMQVLHELVMEQVP